MDVRAASHKDRSAALAVLCVKCQGGIPIHLQMNGLLMKQEFINTHFWKNSHSLNETSDATLLDAILLHQVTTCPYHRITYQHICDHCFRTISAFNLKKDISLCFMLSWGTCKQDSESERASRVTPMITFLEKVPFYCLASRERAKPKMFSPWVPLNKIKDRDLSSAQPILGEEL